MPMTVATPKVTLTSGIGAVLTRNRYAVPAMVHASTMSAKPAINSEKPKIWVYPDFPPIFRGFSEFFVGDLMGKALWKLVENAQRFPRRGGRVLCVHGPVSFHRARPCATKWPPRRGLRTGPPASSDCGRPVNDKCSHQHRRSVQAERSSCPGKTVISGTYAIWETRI